MKRRTVVSGLLFTLALAVTAVTTWTEAMAQSVQRGQIYARANCSKCHSVEKIGPSPLSIAPPFRTLHQRYPVEELEEALAEGIVTGHPSMPEFVLDPG